VRVIAPEVVEELAGAGIAIERRRYQPGEAGHYRLVVAATDDPVLNRRICSDAAAVGAWANDVTDPDGGSMALPAVARRGRVSIAVSTGGASPGLAAWLRDELTDGFGDEVAVLADLVAAARDEARSRPSEQPLPDWRAALDSGMLDLIRQGRVSEAKERLQACRSSSSD
jgi:precorrin-2 dehydrogenase/sirohydrochlorin ferrochelatase